MSFFEILRMGKLTLHIPEDLIAAAKSEAATRQVSVSKLVTDYFRNLEAGKKKSDSPAQLSFPPKTQRLVGCLKDPDLEGYHDYLEKKHS